MAPNKFNEAVFEDAGPKMDEPDGDVAAPPKILEDPLLAGVGVFSFFASSTFGLSGVFS